MRRKPATTPSLFIGGQPLAAQVLWGDLKLTDRWPYGCWEAQWGVVLKPYQRIPALATTGTIVEARIGSGIRWVGTLGQPDWESGQMTAFGLVRLGEQMLCLNNSTGETTSILDTAIDHAIARGLPWIRRATLSSVAFANVDTTINLNYLTALLDAWATANGVRWGINARREVYVASDASKLASAPGLSIRPGVGQLGVSDANQAARIFGRFKNSSGVYANVDVGAGVPEVGVSLERYGVIDSTKATNVITGIRDAVQPKAGFSNGVTVTADMVTSIGGQRLGLEQVVAGQPARMLGLRDERGALAYTDIVLGQSVWDVSAGQVAVNPTAMDDQSLAGVVEAAGGVLL